MIELAVNAGLVVDDELKETERRNSAFADDTTGAFLRTAENLSLVKNILYEFGQVSGLETNIEKTSLMPVGLLTENLEPEIIALGFDIVSEIKCLGMTINNRSSLLENHFDEKILKVRQLIGSWSRFNLSLPGRQNCNFKNNADITTWVHRLHCNANSGTNNNTTDFD
jgi:hypothetical protein